MIKVSTLLALRYGDYPGGLTDHMTPPPHPDKSKSRGQRGQYDVQSPLLALKMEGAMWAGTCAGPLAAKSSPTDSHRKWGP